MAGAKTTCRERFAYSRDETKQMPLRIRPFRPSDTGRLRIICEQTAIERPFLPYLDEPRLASAFYLDPYLELESECCFVAEVDDHIAGYLVGTLQTQRFETMRQRWLRKRLPRILRMHLAGLVRGRYRALSHRILAARYVEIVGSRGRDADRLGHVDTSRYPAHCHLQVAPEARQHRPGLPLMLTFHEHLKAHGVPGQHSSVVERADGDRYSRMLLGLRFRVVHERTFSYIDRPALVDSAIWRERILIREM